MTLVVGLRCGASAVLASDSQGTYGSLKKATPKLFQSKARIIWGIAGPIAATQILYTKLDATELSANPDREAARNGIKQAMIEASEDLRVPDSDDAAIDQFEGLFAWHSASEKRSYLLRARSDGVLEFERQYGAVGSSRRLAEFGFFALNRSEYLDYASLPLETAMMLAHMAADDAIRASAQGVDGPTQLAVVTASEAAILEEDELRPIRDTASAFRMHQADFLVRTKGREEQPRTGGLIPDGHA